MVIPHRLIQVMAIVHLGRKGRDHLLPGGVLIPLRIAGIDEVAVAIAATDHRQATRHAQGGQYIAHESFHTFVLLCPRAFCERRRTVPHLLNRVSMIFSAAGPTRTTKMPGKMKSTSGKINCTAVLAAFSSASCRRRVRIESDWTRSAWAMLEPNRSAWIKMAARLRTSSTPVRTPRS